MNIRNSYYRKGIIRLFSLMIFVFLSGVSGLKSQTYYFDSYGVPDGLSSSKVYTIIQDRYDYLWLGTESGVSRWDGSEFENFTADDSLATGGVYSLYEDKTGRIWFGHLNGGLSCYYDNNFWKVGLDTIEINSDITSIIVHKDKLWILTALSGAFSVTFPDPGFIDNLSSVKQYRGSEGLSDQLSDSYINPKGDLFCIADLGIKLYQDDEDRFISYKPEGLSSFFNTITMFEDSKGGRWFGTHNGGLYYFEPQNGELSVYDIRDGLAGNMVSCINEDSKGQIWVGTWGGGISVFSENEIRNYHDGNGLQAMSIHSIMEDREGNILVSSQYNGIHVFKGDHFINYMSDQMFRDKNIWAVNEDKFGRFWFGTNEGITLYDPELKLPWFFNEEENNVGNKVRFIINDRDGNVWVGTYQRGIFKYDFTKNDFVFNQELNDNLYRDLIITALVVDNDNNLWIGTHDGVAFWDIEENTGRRYTRIDGLTGLGITSLFIDSQGMLWIGSEREAGLTRYDPEKEEFKKIELGYNLSPKSITETEDGTIWLGTIYGVLGIKGDTIAVHLTEKSGLLSNDIKLLQPDNRGALYIGTNSGLNRFNIDGKTINTYTEENGFVGIETKHNASFFDSDDHLWFGTANGVTRLAPEDIPLADMDPLTHIKGMTVNFKSRDMAEGMRLNYKEKNVTFNYYSVCLTNPEAVRYRVMLEGADPDWRPETDHTQAIYSALSPGRYTFLVKALNSDGIWNKNPVSYSFVIRPPFYFNPLFIIIVVILLAMAVVTYIKVREKNLIREKQILEEKVEERTAEVVQKSLVIEEKNRDITASIRYAERIQKAMLPPENSFDDTFVLFLPKDIVSGDFYWMYDNGETQFISAVDCTGHGVPGAFMSIIGYNSLMKITREYGLTRPAAILDQLNVEVTRALLTRGEEVINDGMDLALTAYNRTSKKLEYAGAYNPLVIIRDGEVITIRADRFPIGMSSAKEKKFTNQEVEVVSGDVVYMFSDGYADQFGGPKEKKFKSVNLKNELVRISNMPMDEQKEQLIDTIHKWMGETAQIDDILVIGTRIP